MEARFALEHGADALHLELGLVLLVDRPELRAFVLGEAEVVEVRVVLADFLGMVGIRGPPFPDVLDELEQGLHEFGRDVDAAAQERSYGVALAWYRRAESAADPAVREVTRTRLFAERAMFLAQRMPFLVRWPGRVPAGTVSGQVIGLTDVLATLADVQGFVPLVSRPFPGLSISDNAPVYFTLYLVEHAAPEKLLTER